MSISDPQLHNFAIGLATASGIWLALAMAVLVFLAERWSTKQDEVLQEVTNTVALVAYDLQERRLPGNLDVKMDQSMFDTIEAFRKSKSFSKVPRDGTYESIVQAAENELTRLDSLSVTPPFSDLHRSEYQRYEKWRRDIQYNFDRYHKAWIVFEQWLPIPELSSDLVSISKWVGILLLASLATAFFSVVTIGSDSPDWVPNGFPDWINTLVVVAAILPVYKASTGFIDALKQIKRMTDPNI